MTTRSMACVCGRSLAGVLGLYPSEAWMSVCCECCVLSGRGLCFGLITRPDESYRVWFLWVWSWSLHNEEGVVLLHHEKKVVSSGWLYAVRDLSFTAARSSNLGWTAFCLHGDRHYFLLHDALSRRRKDTV